MTVEALWEREAVLDLLAAALGEAHAGEGRVVLLSGEAGIGKTSVVRAFLRGLGRRARVLSGACDDLVTPRTLGPLRDAARALGDGSALAEALTAGDRDAVLTGLMAELSTAREDTVLVLEDVHWADDATLDVLRYVGRRAEETRSVLVVTYRSDEVGASLQRVLGVLAGAPVRRVELPRLSRAAVARWAGGTNATSADLYRLTSGNPFLVSEALASGPGPSSVPGTVADAVTARVRRLEPVTQGALERLAVVPSEVDLGLARDLLGDLDPLAAAEQGGVLEFGATSIAFRHELTRRAVEDAMPSSLRLQHHGRVLGILRERTGVDPARLVHHALGAADDAAVVEFGPLAAEGANRAGAHAQEVTYYEHVLSRSSRLDAGQRAALLQAQATALFTTDRLALAQEAGAAAVRLREDLGAPGPLGEALVALAPIHWAVTRPDAALAMSARAVDLLAADGDSARRVWALLYRGLLLTAVDRYPEARPVAEAALDMAARLDVAPLVALGRVVRGRVRLELGDEQGHDEIVRGVDEATTSAHHLFVMMGHVVLVQELWRLGRLDELERRVDQGCAYAQERELDFYLDFLLAHRYRLWVLRGRWDEAEDGLRRMVGGGGDDLDVGGATRHGLPLLARLLVRRGSDDAAGVLDRAGRYARAAGGRYELVPALLAEVEHAWLLGEPARARDAVTLLDARTAVVGAERQRAELLRWQQRLGDEVAHTDGPEPFGTGLRGAWRAAAQQWSDLGAPYEQALELADSGEVRPCLEALAILDRLGADPAARLVRRRLRSWGVTHLPRGPKATTRANPAGLTDRQVEILRLVAEGRTNAEIASRLVLSVRTVDHHVSAVLQKLDLPGRRDAAAALDALELS